MSKDCILVIDDNPTNLKLASDVLEFEGYKVHQAVDAEAAQKTIASNSIDLILMDLALPGMDGLELTRLLKADAKSKHITIVALTAFAMKGDDAKAREAGCDGYITKPIDTRTFTARIREHLDLAKDASSKKPPMNILIVDIDSSNLKLLRAILESEDYTVTEANDGTEAIAALEAGGVDAIISDILMPNMDGYRLCHEVRQSERFHHLPFIAYTATYVSDDDAKVTLDLGADTYIRKPAPAHLILASLREVTSAPSSKRAQTSPVNSDILQAHIEQLRSKLEEEHSELAAKTKIKHLNTQLRESNRKFREYDRFKSEFLATASHEMRTPLTIIREFASLMADGAVGEMDKDQSECLDSILRNCDRLTSLINDLLDLARIESGRVHLRREKLEIKPLLLECVADFTPRFNLKSQSLVLDLGDEDVPAVLADRAKIQQVLVNLICNAHKFTQAGGTVTIRAVNEGGTVRIVVEDDGPGIDTTQLETIFDAFTQIGREEGPGLRGTGLGLTITRKLVQFHDGEISVSSEESMGATFSFTLPIHSIAVEHKAFLVDQTRSSTKGMVATVFALAPRSVHGTPGLQALQAIKSRCDLAIPEAKTCRSISEDGVFLYLLESPKPVTRTSILKKLEAITRTNETLICERDTLDPNNPARSLTRVRARILHSSEKELKAS